jgi:2-oxoglutarate ferredoxin oxidoreductase subunit delta
MICFNVCPRKVFGVEKEVDKDGYRKIMVERAGDCSGCMLCAFLCPDIALEVKKC